jgi:hypothetical protein
MRLQSLPGLLLAGPLLLLIAVGPLLAGPKTIRVDSRQTWLFNQGTFRFAGTGRWIEQGPAGTHDYRENHRTTDFLELFDPVRKRYIRLYARGQYVYVPAKKHFAWVCPGRWADPGQRPLDMSRHPVERNKLTAAEQRAGFPRLGAEFEVLAPATVSYNCIGWSVGNQSSWVWPSERGQTAYLQHFDALYQYYGFRRIAGLDLKPQRGYDKVLLYAIRRSDGSIQPTHASLQLSDGSWSSKVGSLPLIRHLDPNDLAGPTYGAPWVVYVRPRSPRR